MNAPHAARRGLIMEGRLVIDSARHGIYAPEIVWKSVAWEGDGGECVTSATVGDVISQLRAPLWCGRSRFPRHPRRTAACFVRDRAEIE